MRPINDFKDAEAALEPFHAQPNRVIYTTEHIKQFMDYVGNPQDKSQVIHIAGTSGKTSTAYYTAALLKLAGKKVGLMVSPHVTALNERVQINLEPLPERQFCDELSLFLEVVTKSAARLSYAEVLYAFAYWEFVRHRVDCIVVEVGLGGLLDATNVISRADKVCIITDIGLDHTKTLGGTLEEITQHKAGIIQLHNTVFCLPQEPIVIETVRDVCRQKQADLHIVGTLPDSFDIPLFQMRNLHLAVQAVQFVLAREGSSQLSEKQIVFGAQTRIPARMEIFVVGGKTVILDGAHNPQKMHALRLSMRHSFDSQPVAVLAAFVEGRGRDAEDLIAEMMPIAHHVILTALPPGVRHHIGRDPQVIADICQRLGARSVEVITDRSAALKALLARPEKILLITGSFYLLEEMRPQVAGIS
jgi:dihydrofolate synthase/folylpolyglutamate synthase